MGFNPRPPLQAGASFPVWNGTNIILVSILARLYRRALLSASQDPPASVTVSILARLYRRALRNQVDLGQLALQFQSSPAFTGGRFGATGATLRRGGTFQSSPAFTGGRFDTLQAGRDTHQEFQSSPAFTGGRFADRLDPVGRCAARFNPRPPLQAGASISVRAGRYLAIRVSILARLYRRALRKPYR